MTWRDEPATDKQIKAIQDKLYSICWELPEYEVRVLRSIIQTKGNASHMIDVLDDLTKQFPDNYDSLNDTEAFETQKKLYEKFQSALKNLK